MAFTYVTLTHTFETAADLAAVGTVDFTPVDQMYNGVTVVVKTVTATLTGAGGLTVLLAANTDPGTFPTGTTYRVDEHITGQPARTYYIQIPHNQGSTINLRDLSGWVGGTGAGVGVLTINSEAPDGSGNVIVSASDVGAQPVNDMLTRLSATPQTVAYAASVTLNAFLGTVFRTTATGNLAVAGIINGLDGQPVDYEVTASGGARTVTITGVTDPVVIPSGDTWIGQFRYNLTADIWRYKS